jgi:hypothetical protein
MKLSDAIRLGSMTVPQHFGALFLFERPYVQNDDIPPILSACAAGSALMAIGVLDKGRGWSTATYWPWTADMSVTCPYGDGRKIVCDMIVHLNDSHMWTREQIADWVATIEPTEMTEIQEPEVIHETV